MARIPRAELLEWFLQESEAYLPEIRQGLAVIKGEKPAMAAVHGLCRLFHGLRGAAERVQLTGLSRGVYIVEALLADLAEEDLPLSDRLFAAVGQTVELLEDFIWKKRPTPEDEVNLFARISLLFAEFSGNRLDILAVKSGGRERRGPAGQPEYRQAVRSLLPLMLELAGYLTPDGLGGKEHFPRIHGTLSRALLTLAAAARAVRRERQRQLFEEFHLLLENFRHRAWSRQPEAAGLIVDFLGFLEAIDRGGDGENSSAAGRVRERLRNLRMLSDSLGQQLAEALPGEERQAKPEAAETAASEEHWPMPEVPAPRPGEADHRQDRPEDHQELQKMEQELAAAGDDMAGVVEAFSDKLKELERVNDSLRRRSQELAAGFKVNVVCGGKAHPGEPSTVRRLTEIDPAGLDLCLRLDLLIKSFNDISVDFNRVYATLATLTGDIGGQLCNQQLTMRVMQDKLTRIRMTPISAFSQVLSETVRNAAKKLNKKAKLVLSGEDVYLDRLVWAKLVDPLMGILSDAVEHGIESAEKRASSGKPAFGTIDVEAEQRSRSVILRISDDGGAMSGRALGCSAFRGALEELGGTVRVLTTPGQGGSCEVHIPCTVSANRVVMVAVAGKVYAVPLRDIRQVKWFGIEELDLREGLFLRLGDDRIPVVNLGYLLQLEERTDELPPGAGGLSVIVFQPGDRQLAVSVSEVIDQRWIIVKSLGSHLTHVPGVSGVTLTGHGVPVPIVNLRELTSRR